MKAEYSVEEVLAYAEALREALRMHRAGRSTMFSLENSAAAAPDMLNNLAERIKADEGAVPFCRVEDVDANVSHMAQTGVKPGDPLYLRPPAQAAQVDSLDTAVGWLDMCGGSVGEVVERLAAEPMAQGEADLCDCDADKYNKLPHHADCAALAAQLRAVPDEVAGVAQHIATAVELSCKDRERLERDYRYMRDRRDELQRQLDSALRSNAALRGVINRMKKATSKKAQP